MQSDFLRKKARTLELLADACFDIDISQRLRVLADEFQTLAEKEERSSLPPASFADRARTAEMVASGIGRDLERCC